MSAFIERWAEGRKKDGEETETDEERQRVIYRVMEEGRGSKGYKNNRT